jgi:rhodanese-related sulfurtransferase
MPKQMTVTDARAMQEEGAVYVDVRSQAEFEAGHPAGAVNIPLLDRDPRSGQMAPNPDFVEVMKANFPADATLLMGCQMGGRSNRAAQILETFGFTNLTNVIAGYGGWLQHGLPVETDAEGRSYADMAKKAGIE